MGRSSSDSAPPIAPLDRRLEIDEVVCILVSLKDQVVLKSAHP